MPSLERQHDSSSSILKRARAQPEASLKRQICDSALSKTFNSLKTLERADFRWGENRQRRNSHLEVLKEQTQDSEKRNMRTPVLKDNHT